MRIQFLKLLAWFLKLLSQLTLWKYKPGIVGVTGSVGKTSTKMAIAAVLSRDRKVRASEKSFNNEIGMPLTILGNWEDTTGLFFWFRVFVFSLLQLIIKNPSYPQILVLEYGVQRPGDLDYLLRIAEPQIGVVTAFGDIPVHVEFFAGPEAVKQEKAKLVGALPTTGFAVLNADDVFVKEMKENTRAHPVTFGFSAETEVRLSSFLNHLDKNFAGITFKLAYGGSVLPIRLPGVFGRAQSYAAAAAAAVGLLYGVNLVRIAEALQHYQPPAGRLRFIPGIKNTFIIDDTYNASPAAMQEAVGTLKNLKANRKIAVLGDMLELGKYTMETHEGIGRLIPKSADILFTVGGRAKFIAEAAARAGFSKKKIFSFTDVNEAGLALQAKIQKGDLILVKGSQAVRMEKIVKEIMAEPMKAEELLVRQSPAWLKKSAELYS